MALNDTSLAELQGFFRALAWVNNKTNHGYTFRISARPATPGREAAIKEEYDWCKPRNVVCEPAEDSRRLLRDTLLRWLLAYLNGSSWMPRLVDPNKDFSLSHDVFRDMMLDPVLNALLPQSENSQAFRIQFETDSFYACESTDLLIASDMQFVFLHFAASD